MALLDGTVLLEQMVLNQEVVEMAEPVELEQIFHQYLVLVLEYVE